MIAFLFYWIIKGIVREKHNQIISTLLIILIPLLITYSWGVGNFGTALRHRSKFIPVFIAISTIYVPKITLTKKSEVPKPNE
jgi:biotin transporter BioY